MFIMNEKQNFDNVIEDSFEKFIRRFKINSILRRIGAVKEKGVSTYLLFAFLLRLVFTHKNFYTTFSSGREALPFEKDAVYRFLGNASIRWEELVPAVANAVIPVIDDLTSAERKCALIVDDTPYYRNRSKKVELLSRRYDHSEKRYYKGFTMLNLGWSDGVSFVPVDFRLVASGEGKNLLEGSHVKEDLRTIAAKRRKQAQTTKPELVLQMLKNAKNTPAQAKYVLFDSWFSAPKALLDIKGLGYDVVARLKNHENYRYLHNGELLSIGQILRKNKKRRGKARYLLSVEVHVRHNDYLDAIPAKIVYVRDKNNSKKWIALISTDVTLSEEEIIALYGKRWDIEPFHKVIKSTLKLTKEFQLRSFDAIVAHIVVVLVRYIFLSLANRENIDERSIGELFWFTCEELVDISFAQAFAVIINALKSVLSEIFLAPQAQVEMSVSHFIANLPCCFKERLRFSMCES